MTPQVNPWERDYTGPANGLPAGPEPRVIPGTQTITTAPPALVVRPPSAVQQEISQFAARPQATADANPWERDYTAPAPSKPPDDKPGFLDVIKFGMGADESPEAHKRARQGLGTMVDSLTGVFHPLLPQNWADTGAGIASILSIPFLKAAEASGYRVPGTDPDAVVKGLTQYAKDRYGSAENIKRSINKDPFGVALDLSMALEGGGAALRGGAAVADIGNLARTAGTLRKAGEVTTAVGREINPVVQATRTAAVPLRPVVRSTVNFYQKLNTPFEMPEAAAGRVLSELEQRMMTTKWGDVGDVVTAAGEGHAGAAQVLEQMRTADTPAQVQQASMRLQDFRTGQRSTELYQTVQNIANQEGQGNVPPAQTRPLVQGLSNRLRKTFVRDDPTLGVIRGIEDKLQPKLIRAATKTAPAAYGPPDTPFLTMQEASSDLERIIREGRSGENAVIGEKGIGQLQTVKNAIDADIQGWGRGKSPKLLQALEDANQYYREERVPFKDINVAKSATTDEPSQILKKFVQDGNPERAQKFYEALDPKGRAAVQTGLIQNAANAASDPVQPFSSEKFIQALEQQRAATGVFFQGKDAHMLDGLRNLVIDTAKTDINVKNWLPAHSLRGISLRWLTDTEAGRQILYRLGATPPGTPLFEDLVNRAKGFFQRTPPSTDEPPPVPRPPTRGPGSPGEPPQPAPAAPANLRDLPQPITDPSRLLPAPPRVFYMGPGKDTSGARVIRGQYPEVTPPLFRNLEDVTQPAPATPQAPPAQRTLADVVQPGQTFEEANAEPLRRFGESIQQQPPAAADMGKGAEQALAYAREQIAAGKNVRSQELQRRFRLRYVDAEKVLEDARRSAPGQAQAPAVVGATPSATSRLEFPNVSALRSQLSPKQMAEMLKAGYRLKQEGGQVVFEKPPAGVGLEAPATAPAAAATIEPDAGRDTSGKGQAVQEPFRAGARVAEGPQAPRRTSAPATGEAVSISIPGETTEYPARYGLRELEDIYPSHSGITFQPNPDYHYKNTRNYADKSNQERVVVNSMAPLYKPGYIITDAPDATNGPPIIDAQGNVLGGNNRAMIMQRVYSMYKKGAEDFRELLARRAHVFGLKPEDVRAMKRPMLVRELDAEVDPRRVITDFNKKGTADYTASERAAADAGMLSPEAAEYLAGVLESEGADATLYEVLDSARGPEIVNKLVQDGVFTLSEKNAILDEGTKKVTAAGKERISKMLLGALFDDAEQIKNTAPSLRNKLERVVSPILQTSQKAGFDLVPATKDAIRLLEYADAHNVKNLDDLLGQETLFGGGQTAGDLFPPEVVMLAKYLREHSPLDIVRAYRRFIANSEPTMFGESTRAEALGDAFQSAKPLSQADELKLRRLPPQK